MPLFLQTLGVRHLVMLENFFPSVILPEFQTQMTDRAEDWICSIGRAQSGRLDCWHRASPKPTSMRLVAASGKAGGLVSVLSLLVSATTARSSTGRWCQKPMAASTKAGGLVFWFMPSFTAHCGMGRWFLKVMAASSKTGVLVILFVFIACRAAGRWFSIKLLFHHALPLWMAVAIHNAHRPTLVRLLRAMASNVVVVVSPANWQSINVKGLQNAWTAKSVIWCEIDIRAVIGLVLQSHGFWRPDRVPHSHIVFECRADWLAAWWLVRGWLARLAGWLFLNVCSSQSCNLGHDWIWAVAKIQALQNGISFYPSV